MNVPTSDTRKGKGSFLPRSYGQGAPGQRMLHLTQMGLAQQIRSPSQNWKFREKGDDQIKPQSKIWIGGFSPNHQLRVT